MLAAVEQKGKQGGRGWGRGKGQQQIPKAPRHQGHKHFQLCSRSWGPPLGPEKGLGAGPGQSELSWQPGTLTPTKAHQQEVWSQTVWKSFRNSRGTSSDQLGQANPPRSWCTAQLSACRVSSRLILNHFCCGTCEELNGRRHSSKASLPSPYRCLSQTMGAARLKSSFYFLKCLRAQHTTSRTGNHQCTHHSAPQTLRDPVQQHYCKAYTTLIR